MARLFTYIEHPRIKEREVDGAPTTRKTRAKLTHGSAVARINAKIGLGITTTVGTMWCAYVFILLALVSLPGVLGSGDPVTIVGWLAQTFIQLVLLPVIIVGQNVQAAAADERSTATYKDAGAILQEAKQIQAHLASQDAAITTLLDKVLALETALAKK